MEKIKEEAYEILEISQKVYQIQERNNPTAIFGDKTFLIGTKEDREAVSVERNYEKKDKSYYFETSEIDGVIIKRVNGNYCIKAMVKYINANNQNLWFAKIRIENPCDKDIQIMGKWGGSWQDPDYEDENQIKNPNSDFPFALDSMKNHLADILNQLYNNSELSSETYDPGWVKKLKPYNN